MIIVVLVSIVQFELAYVFDHPKKDSVYFQIYLSLPLFSSREHRSSLLMSKSACLSCWMVSGRLYFLRYLKSLMVGLDSVYGLNSSMTPISTFSSLDKCIQFGLTQVSLSRNPANCSINSGFILRRSTNKDPKNSNKSQFTSSVGYENVITNHDIVDNKTLIISNANKAPNSITRTFKGNRKRFELSGVRVIGISNKIAESKVKNSFYCTVNIFITFNCRNVKWKLKDTSRS